jgi:mono/diheme cytochrome c family protein
MRKIIVAILITCFIAACKTTKDTTANTKPTIDCTSSMLTYTSDIKSIIETNCSRCHNTNMNAGYNFLTLESVKKAASNGELLRSIKHEKGITPMPAYADQLDLVTIGKIECWINNGMK